MQLVDSVLDEIAQQKRGESILYIFSAIEQSPRSVDRQTPQRARERLRRRGGEEERQSMLRLMVLSVCVGSAASSHGPGRGLHSARVCGAELSKEGGHSWLGRDSLTVLASTSSVNSDILALQLLTANSTKTAY